MCINLCANIVYNMLGIPSDYLALFIIIAIQLRKISGHNIQDKICIVIGQFTDRIEQQTGQCIDCIIHFQDLRINRCQHFLINRIKALNLSSGNFKILNRPLYRERNKIHYRTCLNKNLRNRDCLAGILLNLFDELFLTHNITLRAVSLRGRLLCLSFRSFCCGVKQGCLIITAVAIFLFAFRLRCSVKLHIGIVELLLCQRIIYFSKRFYASISNCLVKQTDL